RGVVLFTTLGARGGVAPRAPKDKGKTDRQNAVVDLKESGGLRELAVAFRKLREGPPLRAQAFGPLVAGQVGYEVVGRRLVLAVLGAFCVGLAAAGWWLRRRGDLAHLGWLGPAAALSAALLFVTLGHRGRVPATVAVAQLVEIAPGAEDATVSGLLALYSPGGPFAPLGAE